MESRRDDALWPLGIASGSVVLATIICEPALPFVLVTSLSSFSFSGVGGFESDFPIIHQLPCFLGIGRSETGGTIVFDLGLAELPVYIRSV